MKEKGDSWMKQTDYSEGNILKQLITFSSPILLTNLLQVSYQIIDSLWVGNLLGARALGVVSLSGTVIFTILSFIIGINQATLTILSQLKGKRDEQGLKRYVNAFVVTLFILSILLGVFGFIFAERILFLLGTPDSLIADASLYLQINFLGIIFLFGYNFVATLMRALGESKAPVYFVVLAVLLNAALDPLFISGFQFGIAGAAYATVISQGIAFLFGIYLAIHYKLVPFTWPRMPKKEEVSLILKIGVPSGMQMMVISAGVTAIMSVVASFGEDALAGFGAAQRLDNIILLPAMALGTAVNSLAGINIGANRWDRVYKIAQYGLMYNLAIMVLISLLILFFARFGVELFIQEEEAVQFGVNYLKIVAFFYPFLGINFVLNGVVRGSGAMMQVLILNIISFWVLRYPLTYLFSNWIGEDGIGVGMGVSFVISSLFAFLYFRLGGWRKKELFHGTV